MTRTGVAVPEPRVRPAEPVEQLDEPALDQAGIAGRVLGLDGEVERPSGVRDELEEPLEGQHPTAVDAQRVGVDAVVPGPEVELVELGQLEGRDDAAGVAGAVDPAVVDADEVTVGGQAYVALERIGARVDGPLVGGHRVLGRLGRGAPVRDHLDRSRPAREGRHIESHETTSSALKASRA